MIKVNEKLLEFEKFPNNETLFKSQIHHILDDSKCVIKFKYGNDTDLIKLMLVKKEVDSVFKNDIILKIMYYPYSRMDRGSETINFTLKYISEFINYLKFDEVIIYEPHSDVCLELTNNSSVEYFTPNLVNQFNYKFEYILFPDKGAKSRYEFLFRNYNILSAEKTREFSTGKITDLKIVDDFVTGSDVLIVDDLSSFGGTFLWAARKLKEKGANKIYLIVGHCEESILRGKIPDSGLIEKVFTTNSIINKSQETDKIKIMEVI